MSFYAWIYPSKYQSETRLVLERGQNRDNCKNLFLSFFCRVVLRQKTRSFKIFTGVKYVTDVEAKFSLIDKFPISLEMKAPQRRRLLRYYYP